MEHVMTFLADEQKAFVWAIRITGMPTHRASFARVVGIHLNSQTSRKTRFVGNHGLQFSKRPLGVGGISFPPLLTHLFAFLAFGSFSNVCQMLQADQMIGIVCDDAFGDTMIGVLLQPSLSSANHHQTAGSRTS